MFTAYNPWLTASSTKGYSENPLQRLDQHNDNASKRTS
jgi:hypothetical protein